MRIPFPTYIPMQYVSLFAIAVAAMQLVQGTNGYFALCSFLFILVAGFAFNTAGGLAYPSGAYIFWYSTLTAIVAWLVKISVGEAADSNLKMPNLTVSVYLGTMIAMAVSVQLSKRFTLKKALLGSILTDENAGHAAISCAIIGSALGFATGLSERTQGDFLSAVQYVNYWPTLAIIIGARHEIRKSGGTRSVNAAVLLSGIVLFVSGLSAYSKEGIFTPVVTYVIICAAMRYKFSLKQVGAGILVFYLMLHYLIPYSQYGRTLRNAGHPSFEEFRSNLTAGLGLLQDPEALRAAYLAQTGDEHVERSGGLDSYFNKDQGLFERLNMLSPDDQLIYTTEETTGTYGLYPLMYYVYNVIPHFIWADKPETFFGNEFAREAGIIGEGDVTTGVSFSPGGAAYHMGGWSGVFLAAPVIFFLCFLCLDSLCGDARSSPWSLLLVAYFAHQAPEGMLGGPITAVLKAAPAIVVCAVFSSYVMPILGGILIGPKKKNVIVGEDRIVGPYVPKQV